MPRVSVVLPVFNGEATIRSAIRSVLKQEYDDFELIVIDDGSTDATTRRLAEIEDRRVRVLGNDVNLGLGASLNEGLSAATGELIARMDSDDLCHPQRLSRQVAFLDDHAATGLLATARLKVDAQGRHLGVGTPPASHAALWLRLLVGNCISHPSVM